MIFGSMEKDVIVKKSNINWMGVFALRNFKKWEIVIRWDTDNVTSKEEFESLSDYNEKHKYNKKHISVVDGKYIVMQEPEKFLNHSCDANTDILDCCDVAIRDICIGEEITGNYSKKWSNHIATKCGCGSLNCSWTIYV